MANRSLKKYLYDIQLSIDSIYEYLGDKRDLPKLKKQVDDLMAQQTIL